MPNGTDTTDPQTDTVKTNIVNLLDMDAQTDAPIEGDPVDPVACFKDISTRLDNANVRIVNACRKIVASAGKKTLDVQEHFPTAAKASYEVQRYLPGLNKKGTLTGKEAKRYNVVLAKATTNVIEYEKLAGEAENATPISKAKKDVEDQQGVVDDLTTKESDAKKARDNLKIAPMKSKIDKVEVSFRETVVNQANLNFAATRVDVLSKQKVKSPQEQFDLACWKKVLEQKAEFDRLSKEHDGAKEKKEKADELHSEKKKSLNNLEKAEADRLKAYTDKYNSLKKSIDLLIASGTCFGEDHAAFLVKLGEIDTSTKRNEAYEDGVKAIETLAIEVTAAADELQKKVVTEANTANLELVGVKDPADLADDPVRKKRVDEAREVIAKRLRDPLVGTDVVAARSEVPGFKVVVSEVGDALDKRSEQVITWAKVKILYGDELSTIGPASTGDGMLEYFAENGTTKLTAATVLDSGSKKVVVAYSGTATYKSARKDATITVDKDTPTITWRTPVPVLQNSLLTAFTLNNAKAKTSSGKAVNLTLTFNPVLNTQMTTLGDKTLKASYDGVSNTNFNVVAPVSITLKVVANRSEMGKEGMNSGQAWEGPQSLADKELVKNWDTDNSPTGIKALSQKVMSDILTKELTGDELVDYMNEFITTGDGAGGGFYDQPGAHPCKIWFLANGMQVRYKPDGDGRPPTPNRPQFMIEGKTCNIPNRPSGGDSDVAFKVTAIGQPGAYGPNQTIIPEGVSTDKNSQSYKQYMDGCCGTTHLRPKDKVEQTITWANPPDLTVGDKLEEASLSPTAQDLTALEFTDKDGNIITQETVLAAGKDQILRVKGKPTKRYLASTNFVEVKINVKKVQNITWTPPSEIDAGVKLGTVLNAAPEDNAVLSYFDENDQPIDANSVLPAGKGRTMKVTAAATDNYHALTTPVTKTIDVNKVKQTITWNPLKEPIAGVALGEEVLNATTPSGVKPTYAIGPKPVTAATELAEGSHQVTAVAEGTEIYAVPDPVTKTIIVKAK